MPDCRRQPIAALMSGGVDSSVTALLLKQAGWDVVGVTMHLPVADACSHPRPCCGWEAAWVCRQLGLPHYYLETCEAFERGVIAPFREAYAEGRTPSPCIDCNTAIKFGVAMDAIEGKLGIRFVATGHYARIVADDAGFTLGRAVHARRDQSYFLYGIPSSRLERIVFPLGDLEKEEVRAIARANGLATAERTASMELCFAGEADYRNALGERGLTPGPIVTEGGEVVGRHAGIAGFTPGQRRGLQVSAAEPLFVLRIEPATNSVVVGPRARAYHENLTAIRPNILLPHELLPGRRLLGRIRSNGAPSPCEVAEASDDLLRVRFDPPVFAPAPGQHLVLYDGDGRIVAGGVIAAPE